MRMRREQICALLTVAMTAAFFVTLLWGYGQYQQNKRALVMLENEYQRAYYNYLAELNDMTLAVGKAYSSAALQQAALLGRLQILAESAADHMSRLPMQQAQYQRSVAYLNQVGDYAASLAESLGRGEKLDERQRRCLGEIYDQLQSLEEQMSDMEEQVASGTIVFARAEGGWWQACRTALAGSRAAQGKAAAAEEKTADGYFSRMNALLDEIEPLSYAGKYSAHMDTLPAQGLAGLKQISAEQAETAATEFLALTGQATTQPPLAEDIAAHTALPLYGLHYGTESGESIYVTVSQTGGKIISYAHERELGGARVSAETALVNAEELLQKAGYADMRLVGRQRVDEALLLQYVPLQQGVLCYPDSLSMKVALDNGEIVVLDARSYWLNNHQRALPAGGHSLDEATAALGATAQISGTGLACISDGAGGEIFCHEIRHSIDGEEYLAYIGVENLLEEQILRGYTAADGSFYTR